MIIETIKGAEMETYTVKGISNEAYTIGKIESVEHLPALAAALVAGGKEPAIYHMHRVVTGRKKPGGVACYRFAKSGNFIQMV